MRYSEIECRICGVSFNISRTRTDDEPRIAAWLNHADALEAHVLYTDGPDFEDCGPGCYFVHRIELDDLDPGAEGAEDDLPEEEPGERTGNTPDSRDEEDSDFESDVEAEAGPSHTGLSVAGPSEAGPSQPAPEPVSIPLHRNVEFRRGIPIEPRRASAEPIKYHQEDGYKKFLSSYTPASIPYLEHIAGPECRKTDAYNGNFISPEVMKGCNTAQALARKPPRVPPPWDAEPWETNGKIVMSGLGDHVPGRSYSVMTVFPTRWNMEEVSVDRWSRSDFGVNCKGMPVHTACLEIFKRVSDFCDGVVDLEGLVNLWYEDRDGKNYPRSPDVTRARASNRQPGWCHHRGSEYLAANPCLVPGLDTLFASAEARTVSRFQSLWPDNSKAEGKDPLNVLPPEIMSMVARYLDFQDVRNLELVSPAFRDLPQRVFYEMTVREAPWLYEAWSSMPLSWWATQTEVQLFDALHEDVRDTALFMGVLNNYGTEFLELGELETLARAQVRDAFARSGKKPRPQQPVRQIETRDTDWYWLRYQLEKRKEEFQGLKNRQRIWTDCVWLLGRIDEFREKGKIPLRE